MGRRQEGKKEEILFLFINQIKSKPNVRDWQ